MSKINFLNSARLSNRETVAFLSQVIESSKMVDSESKNELFANLEQDIKAFSATLQNDSTVERTKVIVETVTKMKKYVDSINLVSKGFMSSIDAGRSAAASKIHTVIAKYGVINASYVDNAVKINHIVDDLLKLGKSVLQAILVDDIVDALANTGVEFVTLYNERNQYSVSILGSIAKTRNQATESYKNLVTYINGVSILEPEKYVSFIDEVNGVIAKFAMLYPHIKKEGENSETVSQPVDTAEPETNIENC